MALFRRNLGFIFFAALAVADVVRAERESAPAPQIEVQFTVFGVSALKGLAYRPAAEARPLDVAFYNNYRSPLYAYTGSPTLAFYDATELAARKDAEPVARCVIPPSLKKVFLLFFPRASPSPEGLKYEVFAMDDGATHIPAGSFIIINASQLEFVGRINSQTVTIGRGVSAPFKAEKGKVLLRLSRSDNGYENLTFGDQWKLDGRHRSIVVLFPMSHSSNLLPDSRRLTDRLPSESKKERVQRASNVAED